MVIYMAVAHQMQKASLIAMLLWLQSFLNKSTIIFAGVVDEEGNATGIKELVRSKSTIDYAIFGEPSGISNITIAYKGRFAFRLTCDVGTSAVPVPHGLRRILLRKYMISGKQFSWK